MFYRISVITCLLLSAMAPSFAINAAPSTPPGQVDDNAAGWIWRGMDEVEDPQFMGGTAHAGGGSAYCAYTFKGTGIQVVGMGGATVTIDGRAHKLGKAIISVDGKQVATTSLQRSDSTYALPLASGTGLADRSHVLEIAADGGWIVVDYVSVTTPGSAPVAAVPTTGTIPDGDYRLHPKHAPTMCLDVATIAVNGVEININHPSTERPQVWNVKSLGGGRYEVTSAVAPSLALTLVPPSPADGAPKAHLYGYIGDPAQQLLITPTSDGFYRIAPSSNGSTVLDVFKLQTTDGTPTITYGWWQSDNQQWQIDPAK